MKRTLATGLAAAMWGLAATAQQPAGWIAVSNGYTNKLLAVEMKHTPESGSEEGLSEYDNLVPQPTLADEDQQRKETEAMVAEFKSAIGQQKFREVAQDLQIIVGKVALRFREGDFARAHKVPYLNASGIVFQGLRILLDEQTPPERRPSAVVRVRKYAGLEGGYQPLTEILKQRVVEQMAKPGVVYPGRVEIETELGRNSAYVEGIAALLGKYNLKGWQEPLATLKAQLTAYDEWTRATVLPKARTDFRLPAGELRSESGRVRHRCPARSARGHGAPGVPRASGRDEAARGADRERARVTFERLSRRDPRAQETAVGRRRHPPAVSATADAD